MTLHFLKINLAKVTGDLYEHPVFIHHNALLSDYY